MIERYEIKKENGEEILYLYLSYQYEFGSFEKLFSSDWVDNIKMYLKNKRINFHGKKVALVVGGILIATLAFPIEQTIDPIVYQTPNIVEIALQYEEPKVELEEEHQTEEIKEEKTQEVVEEKVEQKEETVVQEETPKQEVVVPSASVEQENQSPPQENIVVSPPQEVVQEPTITFYRSGSPVTMVLEEYVAGVVAAEMPASFSAEALKAQAVLARTYALKRVESGNRLTDSYDTQVYYDEAKLRSIWGSSYDTYWNKVKEACHSTKGQVLLYQGKYIDAVYHSTSNGKTEAARNVWGYEIPYLQSVNSSWDVGTTFYSDTQYKDMNTLIQIFGIADLKEGDIEIISRNESGRVSEVRVQNQKYQGVDLRSLLGLRSSDFDLSFENGNLVISTRGWGHGVGMSQYGANGMAKAGYTYSQILNHYYPGTVLK